MRHLGSVTRSGRQASFGNQAWDYKHGPAKGIDRGCDMPFCPADGAREQPSSGIISFGIQHMKTGLRQLISMFGKLRSRQQDKIK